MKTIYKLLIGTESLCLSIYSLTYAQSPTNTTVLVKPVYVEGIKFYSRLGTYDLSGRYDHNIHGVAPYAHGAAVLYKDRYVYNVNLTDFGDGVCTVLFYLRRIGNSFPSTNGFLNQWGIYGNIVESSSGGIRNGVFYGYLPTEFNGYFPPCGTFGGITVSGTPCDPYAVASVPSEYIQYGGGYFPGSIINLKNSYEKIAPSQTEEGQDDMAKIYYNGTSWVWEVTPASSPSGRLATDPIIVSTNTTENGTNPPCSGWSNNFELSGTICSTTLPVTLTKFTASPSENNSSLLQWTTTAETNSDHFVVEHSPNIRQWQKIGEVAAKGESSELENYNYTHTTPVAGENYYRLKQTDKDGSFTYSRMVSVNFGSIAPSSLLYPNPVSDRLFLKDFANVVKVEILNLSGQTIMQTSQKLPEGIPLQNVNNGMYLVKVLDGNGKSQTEKILVQK